jgi:ribulose bisphosphate carboxylase small subunit
MMRKIKGKEYLFKESIWKMIDNEAKQKLEEKIESLENCLAEEEYLRLLINYREWGKE